MSVTKRNSVSPPANISRGKFGAIVREQFRRGIRRWQRSRAISQLSWLDDRQLEDIGVSRNNIPWVVEGLFCHDELSAKPLPVDRGHDVVIIDELDPRRA